MFVRDWVHAPSSRWLPFVAASVSPFVLVGLASAVHLPLFVLDDAGVMLVVGMAVLGGIGPAILSAVVTVVAPYPFPIALEPPQWRAEQAADLAMLLGIAIVVHRLVTSARQGQEAAEQSAARERRVRQDQERLVAAVAHDLAAPLTAVTGTVQLAKRVGLTQETDQRRVLQRIETATARATSLVQTLTDVQDLDGVRRERMRRVDLCEFVRPIVEMMDQVSDRHPILLHLAEKAVDVDIDAERLPRVFENLLNNAIKYSPKGGRIDFSVRIDAHKAVIVVRDHGIGIAPDVRSRIFEVSYRSPEASATTSGRGLGLHIAAQIVAGHGGTIEACAPPGGGTAILVRLPLPSHQDRPDAMISHESIPGSAS